MPLTTPPRDVAWDATVDPDLVPLIVESDRPEDARKLASLEAKYAKRHAIAGSSRLRRQRLGETSEEVPESRPESAPRKLKKSISSLFHGNSKNRPPCHADPVLVTCFSQNKLRQTRDHPGVE
jgi:hypothetical protein